jgi:purine-binding chemotaxis protein CheW
MRDRRAERTEGGAAPDRRAERPEASTLQAEQAPQASLETRRRKLLRERASLLAREPAAEETGERFEVVEFLLGRERYGIETSYIREVCPLREVTPLPGTPPFVLGIMNLRGEILSVLDIRTFFGLGRPAGSPLDKVIVLRGAAMEFGILADEVIGVRTVPALEVQGSLATLTGIRADYLKGVTGDHLVLLDAGKLLSDRRIVVHEEE